jgi:hypothetical protein
VPASRYGFRERRAFTAASCRLIARLLFDSDERAAWRSPVYKPTPNENPMIRPVLAARVSERDFARVQALAHAGVGAHSDVVRRLVADGLTMLELECAARRAAQPSPHIPLQDETDEE